MTTTLYLIRHAATLANLRKPALLQGRRSDPPLAPIGVRQAELTRDFLAIRPLEAIYSSPLQRAKQTAEIIAQPHQLAVHAVADLTECDVGRWEGRSWEDIKATEPELYHAYHENPAETGYAGGENFQHVHERVSRAIREIVRKQALEALRLGKPRLVKITPEAAAKVVLEHADQVVIPL
ncbi:MAG: histidine phosphatase family protein, partial [Gemmataceae bacterium]|nr:histidine phosphatase family protein [Gemmataceae bacterium]